MGNDERFVVPESVEFTLTERTLTVRHTGDIHLEQTLGRLIDTIAGERDVTLRVREVTGTILAAGDIVIDGPVDAEFIYGDNVTLTGPFIKARAIAANNRLTINAPTLAADVVMAPQVVLTNGVRGRVTMLDSEVPCDKSGITGGFSYEEYDKKFGNAAAFLEDLGLEPPARAGAVAPKPPHMHIDDEDVDDADTADGESDLLAFHMEEVGGEIILPPPVEKPPPPPPPLDLEPDVQTRIRRTTDHIRSAYKAGAVPPGIDDLRRYVDENDFTALRANIGPIWNRILDYHQEQEIPLDRKVTHAFNLIHGMLHSV